MVPVLLRRAGFRPGRLRVGDTVHLAYEKPLTPASGDTPAILEATRCISVITS